MGKKNATRSVRIRFKSLEPIGGVRSAIYLGIEHLKLHGIRRTARKVLSIVKTQNVITPEAVATRFLDPKMAHETVKFAKVLSEFDSEIDVSKVARATAMPNTYPVHNLVSSTFKDIVGSISQLDQVAIVCSDFFQNKGGAQKFARTLIEAARELQTKTLVMDFAEGKTYLFNDPSNFVETGQLNPEEQLRTLRLVLNLDKVSCVNIVNSSLAAEYISSPHGKRLTQNKPVSFALFCPDYLGTKDLSYGARYFESLSGTEIKFFTDNNGYVPSLAKAKGIHSKTDFSVFHVLAQGHKVRQSEEMAQSDEKLKVVWAGRYCEQKRPDIAIGVARLLPQIDFYFFGDGKDRFAKRIKKSIQRTKNAYHMGEFDSFNQVLNTRPNLILYTSNWDGRPNVLVEAGVAELPIMALDSGYIRELLPTDGTRGTLLSPKNTEKEIANFLLSALNDSDGLAIKSSEFKSWLMANYTAKYNKDLFSQFLSS